MSVRKPRPKVRPVVVLPPATSPVSKPEPSPWVKFSGAFPVAAAA